MDEWLQKPDFLERQEVAAKAKKRADRALKKLGRKAKRAAKKPGWITPPGCEATIASEILRLRALVVAL